MQLTTLKLSVFLSITSCFCSFAATNSIVPGRSIGHVRLGESQRRVVAALGPEAKGDSAMGRFWDVWSLHPSATSRRHELDVLSVRDASGRHVLVEQVRVTSPWFTTRRGIQVGSSLSAIRRAFPGARPVHGNPEPGKHQTILLWDDVSAGITFEFSAATHATSARCRAILVHPKRQDVLDEYYPWYMPNSDGVWVNAL